MTLKSPRPFSFRQWFSFCLILHVVATSTVAAAFHFQHCLTIPRKTVSTKQIRSLHTENTASCRKLDHGLRMKTSSMETTEENDIVIHAQSDKVYNAILDSLNTTTTKTTTIDERTIQDPPNDNDNSNALIIMAVLCWGVACLSALDRVAMSVALLPLSHEFGYTETIKGQISSLFSVGYGLAVLPSGLYMSQKSSSPRLVLGGGIALWSLATLATPLLATAKGTLVPLLTARALVGAAEAVVLPSLQKIMSNWVSPNQKSLAVAGIFSGFQAGTVMAYLLSPLVMEQLGGWRGLFYTYGGIGLAILVPWLLLAKDAPGKVSQALIASSNVATVPAQQTPSIEESSTWSWQQQSLDVLRSAPWKEFWQSKGFWAMMLAHAANNWGLYNNLSWTPTFYAEQYGLNVRDSAWLSILPSVTGAAGGLSAGALADFIIKQMEQDEKYNEDVRTMIRKSFQGIALYGPAVMLAVLSYHIPEQPWVAQTLLMGTVGLQAFNAAGYGAANQEKAGEKWSGLLYSLTSLPGVAVGSFGVYATGQILDATQDWSNVFAINALVNVIGATAFVALYNSKQEWD